MNRSATFSTDRKRRFDLIRDWRDEIGASQTTVLFGMLNPSKADEKDDDPTVRKTVGFGRRWGFGRVVLVNLNPIVATDPWSLPHWDGLDRDNQEAIRRWQGEADMVVAAWGSVPRGLAKTIALSELAHSFREMVLHVPLYCIGTTLRGAPLHPSRAAYTSSPYIWVDAQSANATSPTDVESREEHQQQKESESL
jgi:hypothetical protein